MLDTTCSNLLRIRQYLWYLLVCAIKPKALITVDSDDAIVQIPVRIGQRVDTVGQPGNPRGITGFQTLTTPLLIGPAQAAEIATDDYELVVPNTPLYGTVVIQNHEK
uniref:26S proteasome non-ATPase regulatory subunit 2 1A n=1 Tax=Lygus hesperus TaxID=30085 RepID=A0A0A9YNM6_LYGHE